MKKIQFTLLVLATALSLLLSACSATGQQPAKFVLPPDSPEAIAYGGNSPVSVDSRPTIQQKYEECEAKINYSAPGMEVFVTSNTYGQQAATIFFCGEQEQGITWVAAATLSTLVPGQADDAAVRAIMILKSGVKIVGLLTAAYIAGEAIEYTVDAFTTTEEIVALDLEAHTLLDTTSDAEFDQLLANMTTTATVPLNFPSMKHTESEKVKAAFLSLAATNGVLRSKGDCRSSGSVCIWAGANFANMTGSVMISFVACTRVAYAVLTAPLIIGPAAELILTGKLVKVTENAYIDTTVATWTAAFLLGVGGTTGKGYNPAEAVTFGQGWASLEYKRQQYGINLVVAEVHLPLH